MQNTYPKPNAVYATGLPESRILNATYPSLGVFAIDLYNKLQLGVREACEPLEFGPTALDIGARDGRYTPVIRELGITSVTAIDPSSSELRMGVSDGILNESEVFDGTLEGWVESADAPVDCAFVFNMNPNLPSSPEFISALMRAVRPGGLVVTSFVEFATFRRFDTVAGYSGTLEVVEKKCTPPIKHAQLPEIKNSRNDGYSRNDRSTINGWLSIDRKVISRT